MAKCPICQANSIEETSPFCSPRCKAIDLNRWFTGAYTIPTHQAPSEEELTQALTPDNQ